MVQLQPSFLQVIEGDQALVFVELNIPADRTVSVEFSTFDNTTTGNIPMINESKCDVCFTIASMDYTSVSRTLSFPPGIIFTTVNITITQDAINERNETLQVVLRNPTNGLSLGSQSLGSIEIIDNNGKISCWSSLLCTLI